MRKRTRRWLQQQWNAILERMQRHRLAARNGREFTSIEEAVRYRDDTWQTGDRRSFGDFVRGREDM